MSQPAGDAAASATAEQEAQLEEQIRVMWSAMDAEDSDDEQAPGDGTDGAARCVEQPGEIVGYDEEEKKWMVQLEERGNPIKCDSVDLFVPDFEDGDEEVDITYVMEPHSWGFRTAVGHGLKRGDPVPITAWSRDYFSRMILPLSAGLEFKFGKFGRSNYPRLRLDGHVHDANLQRMVQLRRGMALVSVNGKPAFFDRSKMWKTSEPGNVILARYLGDQVQLKFKQGKLRINRKVQVVSAQKDHGKPRRVQPSKIVPKNPFHLGGVTTLYDQQFEGDAADLPEFNNNWSLKNEVGTVQGYNQVSGKWVVELPSASLSAQRSPLVLCDRKDLFVIQSEQGGDAPDAGNAEHVSRTTIKVKVGAKRWLQRPAAKAGSVVIPAVFNGVTRSIAGTRTTQTLAEAFDLSFKMSPHWTEARLKYPADLYCEDRQEYVHIERGSQLEAVNGRPVAPQDAQFTFFESESLQQYTEGEEIELSFIDYSIYKGAQVKLVSYQKDLGTFNWINSTGVTVTVTQAASEVSNWLRGSQRRSSDATASTVP